MTTLVLAALAAAGTWLLVSATAFGRGVEPRSAAVTTAPDTARAMSTRVSGMVQRWVRDRDLGPIAPRHFLAVSGTCAAAAALVATFGLGPGIPTLAAAILGATAPTAVWRRRREAVHLEAAEAWPRMIEELRVLTGPAGRPIPQALLEVGRRGPDSMRPAFDDAQREWALGADFEAVAGSLKGALADATADVTLETLVVAHQVGGDVDARLAALAEDRRRCLADRREADSRQAGARVARWFVVIVPLGMAFVGANLGDGTAAYRTPGGQLAVGGAVAVVAVCWWWAGRIMRLPGDRRVLGS